MMPCREAGERLEVHPIAGFGHGSIAPGSAVALFDPQGRYLGDGTMGGTRGDGIGVDVDRIAASEVAYVVAVSPDGEEMRVFVNRARLPA
ncbi:MAG TPA: hypothetical protein VIU29_02085 [Candidatus Deferrimicrobiaceae bacterium]